MIDKESSDKTGKYQRAGAGCAILCAVIGALGFLIWRLCFGVREELTQMPEFWLLVFTIMPLIFSFILFKTKFLQRNRRFVSWLSFREDSKFYKFLLIPLVPVIVLGFIWVVLFFFLSGSSGEQDGKEWAAERLGLLVSWCTGPQLILAFCLVADGSPRIGMYIACCMAFIAFTSAISGLRLKKGIIGFLGEQKANSSPTYILSCIILFTCAFACIHFAIWTMNSSEYSNLNGWQDAMYFSVVTIATVGYGDIAPLGHLARWIAAIEIAGGFTMLVLALNASLTAWIHHHQFPKSPDNTSSEK